jgi:hypothetical protein
VSGPCSRTSAVTITTRAAAGTYTVAHGTLCDVCPDKTGR